MKLTFSQEVSNARQTGVPLVALESTIITHGMPYPQNIEMAKSVERVIRDEGAVPATLAVISGQVCIGLEADQLDQLAHTPSPKKLSRADLAHAIATGETGGTTVAATMILARLAGIEVFATGGIGGVHRGGELSFDISADLQELSKTAVNVVCAGAKAILDIPKTFEVLETLGVPVFTFGQDQIPAFWSRHSGLKTPIRSDSVAQIAEAFRTRQRLGLDGGQLIACPIPEDAEIPADQLQPIIEQALENAQEKRISQKDVTPFLLQRIFELTNGASLEANIALVRHNAQQASRIAKALATSPL